MDLAAVQRAMSRLYTDAGLRQEFYADASTAVAKLGLTPTDAAAVAATPHRQLEWFAKSLIGKRRNEVAKLMPATRSAIGERFGLLFQRFASISPPTGLHKQLSDALGFARFLRCLSKIGEIQEWAGEIASFEAISAAVNTTPSRWRISSFSFPVDELAKLAPSQSASDLRKRRTVILWFRWSRVARRLVIRLGFSTFSERSSVGGLG